VVNNRNKETQESINQAQSTIREQKIREVTHQKRSEVQQLGKAGSQRLIEQLKQDYEQIAKENKLLAEDRNNKYEISI